MLAALAVMFTSVQVVGQMDWKKLSPTIPTGLYGHDMAYDSARQRVVLFGGNDGSKHLNNTWEWDGYTWANVTPKPPAISPQARGGHVIAYDAARRCIVLFGGDAGNGKSLGDTWKWDGTTWSRSTFTTAPSPRYQHAMAYDADRQQIVLFGGKGNRKIYSDTWLFDGSTWKLSTLTTPSPLARYRHALAYDAVRKNVVLFGGSDDLRTMGDTWKWDGITWKNVTPATGNPPARMVHAMAFDAARQRVVLFGGWAAYNDTWEWDGNTWSKCNPTNNPPSRFAHTMAFDAARGSMVMFGGFHNSTTQNDTWAYTPTDLTASAHIVSVAKGGNVTLNLNADNTHRGKSYLVLGCIDGSGPRDITSGNVTLLLNRDGYFMFTLMYPNNNALHVKTLGTLDTSGTALAGIQVPSGLTGLIGTRFYHAYIVFKNSIDYASTPVPLTLVK